MNPSGFLNLLRPMWLGFRRDRRALFLSVLFPLVFLVIFGGLFGHQTTPKASVLEVGPVAVLDQAMSGSQGPQLAKVLKIKRTTDLKDALNKVKKGTDGAAVQQQGDRLVVHYSNADHVAAGAVQDILNSVIQSANLATSGAPPKFSMTTQAVEDKALKPIQYYTPGLLGWAIASAAMFGASATLVTWRTKGLLRRLRLAPIPISNVFGARIVLSLGVALGQAAIFIGVGAEFFGLKLSDDWWMAFPVIVIGTLSFLAIGLLIGSWASSQDSAQTMTQMVVLPMALLGGSFFPLDAAPQWLRTVAEIFPLRHLNDAMLNVMVRGEGPASVIPQCAVLLGFTLVAAIIAVRLFKWDQV